MTKHHLIALCDIAFIAVCILAIGLAIFGAIGALMQDATVEPEPTAYILEADANA